MVSAIVKGTCSVDGCDRVEWSRGLCHSHYDKAYSMRKKLARGSITYTRLCPSCGRYFETNRKNQLYDTAKCRKRVNNIRYSHPELRSLYEKPNPAKVVASHSNVSDVNVDAYIKEFLEKDAGVYTSVPDEFFTLSDVVNQQNGKCPLCGKSIVDEYGGLDELHTQARWIKPLFEGGLKSLSNREIVHMTCATR